MLKNFPPEDTARPGSPGFSVEASGQVDSQIWSLT